jgi:hypothetical protein
LKHDLLEASLAPVNRGREAIVGCMRVTID